MLSLFIYLAVSAGVSARCVNEKGQVRSWFVMLKMPGGYDYLYADNEKPKLEKGTKKITDEGNPVDRVLEPIYLDKKNQYNFFIYNDQDPESGNSVQYRAHSKGVVIWEEGGKWIQWLIHSVPNFPRAKQKGYKYKYPESGERNGQSFLCIDMAVKDLTVIDTHMSVIRPHIYSHSISDKYNLQVPYLAMMVAGERPRMKSERSEQQFDSTDGTKFTAYAKSKKFTKDLYKDLLAQPGDVMFTETWQNGEGGRLSSDCSGNTKVFNIEDMSLEDEKHLWKYEYKETQDHSKWAVTEKGRFCVGDINRVESQYRRGGGSVCFNAGDLSKQIRDGIKKYEPCESLKRKRPDWDLGGAGDIVKKKPRHH